MVSAFAVIVGILLKISQKKDEGIEQLHTRQLTAFQQATKPLLPLLQQEYAMGDIRYAGTITTQSGKAVAMMAPAAFPANRTLDDFVTHGGVYGVIWISGEVTDSRLEKKIMPGSYALKFVPHGEGKADIEFLNANGAVRHTVPAVLTLASNGGDLIDKIKKVLEDLGIDDFNLVDIEIVFGDPSDVRGSILFWSFHLFDDP